MAIFVGALPVMVVSAIRIYRRRESWRADAGLLAAAAAQIPHHLWLTFESVLTLFGADFIGLRSWPAVAVAVLHLTGVILVAWACCLAGRRLLVADGRLVPMLFAGIAINLAAYVLSTQASDLGSTHELAAVLPFGAVLAGRLIPDRLIPRRPATGVLLSALLAVLAGYAGALAYNAAGPPRPPTTQSVAAWLTVNHLTSGIGDYWTANVTTVASSGRVEVRPVNLACGRFSPDAWESRQSWYSPPSTATFLLLALTSAAGADGTSADATAQFGPAQRTARIGAYEVLVWNHDLLPALTGGFARDCGQQWRR